MYLQWGVELIRSGVSGKSYAVMCGDTEVAGECAWRQHSHVERSAWRVGRGDSVSGWCFGSKQNWWSFLLTKVLTFSSVILLAFSPVVSFHREFSLSPVKETLISFCPKPGIGLPLRMANEHASRTCFSKLGPYDLPPPMCFATETKPRVNRGEEKIQLHLKVCLWRK